LITSIDIASFGPKELKSQTIRSNIIHSGVAALTLRLPARIVVLAGESPQSCPAARIFDKCGRLLAYRAFGTDKTEEMNPLVTSALETLCAKSQTHVSKDGGKRGAGFTCRILGIHRYSSVHPRYSAFTAAHFDAVREFSLSIFPLVKLVDGIFKHQFPGTYELYKNIMHFIVENSRHQNKEPLQAMFGVFPTVCLNIGRTVAAFHFDGQDFPGGMCAITCAGKFNWKAGGQLLIRIGNRVYIFELPPGVPIFLPSAVFKHGNLELSEGESRHSVVFFMGFALAHYYFLNGRSMSKIESKEEVEQYLAGMEKRWQSWINLLPVYSK
jgi:hypothetical protein